MAGGVYRSERAKLVFDGNIDGIEAEAALWAVRSQEDSFSEADLVCLVEWLEASEDHARAYDVAMRLWTELDALRDTDVVAPGAEVIRLSGRRRSQVKPIVVWGIGGAIAAAVAAALVMPMFLAQQAPITTYQTAKGERREVALSDGSRLMLNTDTKLTVQLDSHARRLVLDHGEVALKVTHDASRPLTLQAGDARINDLGTEFDVLRHDGAVKVTVREGSVGLEDGQTLKAGDMSLHREGTGGNQLVRVNADEVFAWQTAHVIYHDQPLSAVVADLNRYFDKPLIVDPDAGDLRLTAILTLDSETSVVERLQDYLPLEARATEKGIYLTRAAGHRSGSKL